MTEYNAQVMDADEFLEHYGVKGMKWGHRKSGGQIHAARARVSKAKANLHAQDDKVASTKVGSKEHAVEKKKYDQMKTEFLNNPDRATSARMTKGEALAIAIFLTPVGAIAGAVGTRARSAHINSKQHAGDYNKKK